MSRLSGSPGLVNLAAGRESDGELNEHVYGLLLGIIRGDGQANRSLARQLNRAIPAPALPLPATHYRATR